MFQSFNRHKDTFVPFEYVYLSAQQPVPDTQLHIFKEQLSTLQAGEIGFSFSSRPIAWGCITHSEVTHKYQDCFLILTQSKDSGISLIFMYTLKHKEKI